MKKKIYFEMTIRVKKQEIYSMATNSTHWSQKYSTYCTCSNNKDVLNPDYKM